MRPAAGPRTAGRGPSGAARACGGRWCGRTAPRRAAAAARRWSTRPRAPWSACSPAAAPAAPRACSRTTSADCPRRAGAPALPWPLPSAGATFMMVRAAATHVPLQARRGACTWRPRQVATRACCAAAGACSGLGEPAARVCTAAPGDAAAAHAGVGQRAVRFPGASADAGRRGQPDGRPAVRRCRAGQLAGGPGRGAGRGDGQLCGRAADRAALGRALQCVRVRILFPIAACLQATWPGALRGACAGPACVGVLRPFVDQERTSCHALSA